MDNSKILEIAIAAAKKAGQIISDGYKTENIVEIKENKSQVTEVDKNAEKAIIDILEGSTDYQILAEETRQEINNKTAYWTVDPLDGTSNFIRRIPFCAVSIALIENNQPKLAVIYNPILGELYTAVHQEGAFLNGSKISCSEESGLIFVNNGYLKEHKDKFAQMIQITKQYSVRKFGATAYELASVACGKVDAFIAWGDELWDHSAGILLVREARGIVTDWKGNEWDCETNYVFASNRAIREGLQPIVKSVLLSSENG